MFHCSDCSRSEAPPCCRVSGGIRCPTACTSRGHRRGSLLRLREMLATSAIRRTHKSSSSTKRCRRDLVRNGCRVSRLECYRRRDAAATHQSHRKNCDRRSSRPAFAVPSLHRQRFRRDARRRRGRPSCRRRFRTHGSAWHSSGHAALHHRPGKTVLQSVLSPALPNGSSLHDESHARHGGSCGSALAFHDRGAACLIPARRAPPFFWIVTEPSLRKWAT